MGNCSIDLSEKEKDITMSTYKMFIHNLGLLLGQLSNDKILLLLKDEGVTDFTNKDNQDGQRIYTN